MALMTIILIIFVINITALIVITIYKLKFFLKVRKVKQAKKRIRLAWKNSNFIKSLRSTAVESEKKDSLNDAVENSKVVIEAAVEKSDLSLLNGKDLIDEDKGP